MDGTTPAFGKCSVKDCESFSEAFRFNSNSIFKDSNSPKVNKKRVKKGGSIKLKNKSKFQKEVMGETHSQNSHNKKHRHHYSLKIKKKKYCINNITDFIKYHKFQLRNDFDKKNVKKFLLSKEEAFKMPFPCNEECVSPPIKNYF